MVQEVLGGPADEHGGSVEVFLIAGLAQEGREPQAFIVCGTHLFCRQEMERLSVVGDENEIDLLYGLGVPIVRQFEHKGAARAGDEDLVRQVAHDGREKWLAMPDTGDGRRGADDREREFSLVVGEDTAPFQFAITCIEQLTHFAIALSVAIRIFDEFEEKLGAIRRVAKEGYGVLRSVGPVRSELRVGLFRYEEGVILETVDEFLDGDLGAAVEPEGVTLAVLGSADRLRDGHVHEGSPGGQNSVDAGIRVEGFDSLHDHLLDWGGG